MWARFASVLISRMFADLLIHKLFGTAESRPRIVEARDAAPWSHHILETNIPARPEMAHTGTWIQPECEPEGY